MHWALWALLYVIVCLVIAFIDCRLCARKGQYVSDYYVGLTIFTSLLFPYVVIIVNVAIAVVPLFKRARFWRRGAIFAFFAGRKN